MLRRQIDSIQVKFKSMIFDPFEWPIVADNKTVEVDINTWQVLRSSNGALRSPDVKTLGFWCYIKSQPFYLYYEKNILIIHYKANTYRIPKKSDKFFVRDRSFFLWRWFTLKKEDELILNCFYRDPNTLFGSICKAFAFDDQVWDSPFERIKEQLYEGIQED